MKPIRDSLPPRAQRVLGAPRRHLGEMPSSPARMSSGSVDVAEQVRETGRRADPRCSARRERWPADRPGCAAAPGTWPTPRPTLASGSTSVPRSSPDVAQRPHQAGPARDGAACPTCRRARPKCWEEPRGALGRLRDLLGRLARCAGQPGATCGTEGRRCAGRSPRVQGWVASCSERVAQLAVQARSKCCADGSFRGTIPVYRPPGAGFVAEVPFHRR